LGHAKLAGDAICHAPSLTGAVSLVFAVEAAVCQQRIKRFAAQPSQAGGIADVKFLGRAGDLPEAAQ
jgi:hypothetical protein